MSQASDSRGGVPEASAPDAVAVLKESLEKLKNLAKDAKRHTDLRDECDAALQRLEIAPATPADAFFRPLKLGCEAAGTSKAVVISLEAIYRLVAIGQLRGKGPDTFADASQSGRVLMDTIVEVVCRSAEQSDELVQQGMVKTLHQLVVSKGCEVHGNSLIMAVDACIGVYKDSKSTQCQKAAQSFLNQMLSVVTQKMEMSAALWNPDEAGGNRAQTEASGSGGEVPASSPEGSPTPGTPATIASAEDGHLETFQEVANPFHRDTLMVLSHLCQLSVQDGQSQATARSKKLALETVLTMLQRSGPVCKASDPFIAILKRQLCISLIKNSVSAVTKIFTLSLQIFVHLTTHFKEYLRTEIGVFIEHIFLRILESGNSSFQHKNKVLQVFHSLCTDAVTALELFLNFDCDVDEKNICERMIDCLSKIAQGKYTSLEHANLIAPEQEKELKMQALEALVKLMGSIVDWARQMTEQKSSPSLGDGGQPQDGSSPQVADSDGEEDTRSEAPSLAASIDTTRTTATTTSIMEQKQRKLELQVGVHKFNMKPKRGLEYLKTSGFVKDDPKAIAEFFMNQDLGLDKTAIGDFLGEDKPQNKAILNALVEARDMAGEELDSALRGFLAIFRLPGEAQKIDRMMEKFAEKYCLDNPDKFANADCAYVLSFALIMLQTDLHNPGIKNKMTKDEFIRNNRGINNGEDVKREYLEKLYDGVAQNPISLKEDDEARVRIDSQMAGASQKLELFARETESIVQKSQEQIRAKIGKHKRNAYVAAESAEHVRPLFEVACWPYLATLAVLLETQDAPNSVELCIEGFKHCIRVAARFDMDTERDAFVSSLAKFTYLTTIKEMKQKNIECIKALLAIGLSEGNNLGPSWQFVLHCISQLERLQLIGSKARPDFQFFQTDDEPGGSPGNRSVSGNQAFKRRSHGLGVSALVNLGVDDRQVELVNSESVTSQIDAAQIDLLFNRSTSLGPGAIVHFVSQLVRVSKEELALVDQPRIFSLQKLVEVADFNMNRIRVVWSRVWKVLSTHFVEVANHQNQRVAMFAIDSLRQLAMKFLEKDELSNYNFQADFLKPFEVIMVSKPDFKPDMKELVVQIISNMVQARINNIKSGWKTVFHILHAAAQDNSTEAAAKCAFVVLEKVLQEHYSFFVENFSEGVRTLLAFAQYKGEKEKETLPMSRKAISELLEAAKYLADKSTPDPPPPPSSSLAGVPVVVPAGEEGAGGGGHPAAHWLAILRGLSLLVGDRRREVRADALEAVFGCLLNYGCTVFDEDTWRMVFNGVIKPLFDDIHHQMGNSSSGVSPAPSDGSQGQAGSWASIAASMGPPTCLAALTSLVRLFDTHLDALSFLLDEVLLLVESCVRHETEAVARIGVEAMKQLLLGTGKRLKPESWTKVTKSILRLFKASIPQDLMTVDPQQHGANQQLPFKKDEVVIQCVVQLLLIDMLQDTVNQNYDHIPPSAIMFLLDALQQSFEFAQEFNQQIELRQTLKRLGFMKEMKQLPGLLKQEREALSCSLKILFQVQGDARAQEAGLITQAVSRLMKLCCMVLQNYISKERLLHDQAEAVHAEMGGDSHRDRDAAAAMVEIEREVLGLAPIVSEVVLRGLRDLPSIQFQPHTQELFPLLCELVGLPTRETQVRQMVRNVLVIQIGPLLGVHAPPAQPAPLSQAAS